jgi:pimeloyl-ACP methyl ester carboxylesterase
MTAISRALLALAAVSAGLLLLLFLAQRRLLYFPDRYALEPAEREGRRLGFEPWRDARGGFIGWRSPHGSGAAVGRVLVLHGNAGSALDRGYLRDVLQAEGVAPLDLFLLEYPGYGPREGAPSEPSIVAATVGAIDQLLADGKGPLLLAGESIGSAAAAVAAAERPAVRGLILLTPLAGVAAVARRHYPWAPSFLLRDRFDATAALARFRGPIAFLVAGADEVVFADLGLALHAGYPGPKRLWVQPGRGHNTVVYERRDPMWREMVDGLIAGGWGAP